MTALLWSTAGLCVKLLPWSAFSIACIRGLLCGLLLLFMRLFKRPVVPLCFTRNNLLAGLCMFLTSSLYVMAIKLTTAANAIVLQYIAPIVVLLYTIFVEHKRPSGVEILLTFIVFAGCALTFLSKLEIGGMAGNILALLSGLALAGQILVNRRPDTVQQDGLLIGCGMSFFAFLPFLLTDPGFLVTPGTVGIGLFLGLVQYGLANLCFARGIRTTDAVSASLLFTIEPILAPVWVFLSIGEAPGGTAVAGFICVISAVTVHNIYPMLVQRRHRTVRVP
jgi:drug/metabolite transporter (DMT)-like permease